MSDLTPRDPPRPSLDEGMIRHIEVLGFGYRFEWHPTTKKLYWISKKQPGRGTKMAENVTDNPNAELLVRIWVMGYRQAEQDVPAK